jgi:hypothetical protein
MWNQQLNNRQTLLSDGMLAWRCYVLWGFRAWVKWTLATTLVTLCCKSDQSYYQASIKSHCISVQHHYVLLLAGECRRRDLGWTLVAFQLGNDYRSFGSNEVCNMAINYTYTNI